MLSVVSSDLTEGEILSVPTKEFTLTHYQSQLVLVGGVDPDDWQCPTNKLWVSADGINWQPSLPPLRERHQGDPHSSAVNTGSPECLVVAGGYTQTVEVLINEEWFIVEPLPHYLCCPRLHVHNGTLIVTDPDSLSPGNYCRVESLLASRFQSQRRNGVISSREVWKDFDHHHPSSPPRITSMLSFGHQLVIVNSNIDIEVLCPTTREWLKVGDFPEPCLAATVLPTGEVVSIAQESAGLPLYKASLKCECSS